MHIMLSYTLSSEVSLTSPLAAPHLLPAPFLFAFHWRLESRALLGSDFHYTKKSHGNHLKRCLSASISTTCTLDSRVQGNVLQGFRCFFFCILCCFLGMFFGFRFDPYTTLARVTGMATTEAALEVFVGDFFCFRPTGLSLLMAQWSLKQARAVQKESERDLGL